MSAVGLLILVGCTGGGEPPVSTGGTSATSSTAAHNPKVEVFGASVAPVKLGDSLDAVKKAAPAPKDAQVFDTSLSFAIFGVDGWAWSSNENESFEVALEKGKVIAIAHTMMRQEGAPPVDDMKVDIGPPTQTASKPTATMSVWDFGDNARIAISFSGKGLFGTGSITMIGPKKKLKLLNYDTDDPETFVTQYDSATTLLDKSGK